MIRCRLFLEASDKPHHWARQTQLQKGAKGSIGCCCSIFNDENGKTVSYY